MDLPNNPFTILTFISAPAILTNASCVLLFGTGNRYARAVDRVHWLFETVENATDLKEAELRLRIRQLQAAEIRTLLIVRALTFFYTAVAGFVASTLICLVGAVLVYLEIHAGVAISFVVGFVTGTIGVFAMITGAIMLARETRYSFGVLREEKKFITERVQERFGTLPGTPASH